MKEIVYFLTEIGKLKKMRRSGFVWLEIKDPETIAQHIFRVAVLNWILALKVKPCLNLEKIIKISLVHDLCEVYAGDMSPYWGLLPKDRKKRKEFLKRWIRLPKKLKNERAQIKFKKEDEALNTLVESLPKEIKKEIIDSWMNYEKMNSPEGIFSKQGDKIETLIQALEYWGAKPDSPVIGWWEEIEEVVDNPILRNFLEQVEEKFYKNKNKVAKNEIEFILKVGKFKSIKSNEGILKNVKEESAVAEDAFLLAIAVWVLSKIKEKPTKDAIAKKVRQKESLNVGKMLKMSLIYEMAKVYTKSAKDKDKNVKNRKSIQSLVSGLPKTLKEKIVYLWDDCEKRKSPEGNFVNQIYWAMLLMQALQHWENNKNFPISKWIKKIELLIDDPVVLEFLDSLYRNYHFSKQT
jgi:putative hydrolases of HD superfamily